MQIDNINEYIKEANNYFINKDFDKAIEMFKNILATDSSNIIACFGLANAFNEKGEIILAIEYYKKAIELNPNYAVFYKNLAIAYAKIEQHELSVQNFLEVIKQTPDDFSSYDYMGVGYQRLQKYDLAIKSFEKSLELNPNHVDAYIHLGACLHEIENYESAIEKYKTALSINPASIDAYNNMGTSYQSLEKFDLAVECYNKVLEYNPNYYQAYINMGVCAFQDKDFNRAIELYKKAIELNPKCHEAYNNMGSTHRIQGNMEEGWKLYEYRFILANETRSKVKVPEFDKPMWDGSDINGKRIYVYHEQGYGDTLMFSRYLPLLRDMGAKIIFKPQRALENFYRFNNFDAEIISIDIPHEEVQFDEHIALASLAMIFKTTLDNIPYPEGYLKADPDKVNMYKEKYFNNDKFKIGIFWQGNPKGSKNRATSLKHFLKFNEIENVQLYSLQKGFGIEQLKEVPKGINIVDLGSTFNDYSDTAAAIENLDLVISIDTSIIHLAGAMNKPVWMLLNWDNEWRWLMEGDSTPWYNSVRLFRQESKNNWEELFDRVKNELLCTNEFDLKPKNSQISPINIFFSTDDNYAQHMSIAIASILKNSLPEDNFNFYICASNLSQKNKDNLLRLKQIKDFNVEFIKVNEEDFKNCHSLNSYCKTITLPTFFRLKIGSYLKSEIKKVIYLDCDVIVKKSLRELWNIDIQDWIIAAVEDAGNPQVTTDNQNRTGNKYYFNAGVLLINLEKWRNENIEQKCFDFVINDRDKIIWVDQDVLNGLLKDSVKLISPHWNMQTHLFLNGNYDYSSREEVINAVHNPSIIHFTTKQKPWNCESNHPHNQSYFDYRQVFEDALACPVS